MEKDNTQIIGRIARVRYSNENFSILSVEDISDGSLINVKGYNLPDGTFTYKFLGKLTEDKTYGKTLNCEFYELFTSSKSDMVRYLKTTIDGVGTKTAEKFINVYGLQNVFEALKDKEKIAKVVKGKKTIDKIYESAMKTIIDKELFFLLMSYDIPLKKINEISSSLDNPYEQVINNPFILTKFNIPFKKMNKIAIDKNIKIKSVVRISCAIRTVLRETISQRGHLFTYYDDLVQKTLALLNDKVSDENKCSKEAVNIALKKMKEKQKIVLQKVNDQYVIYDNGIYNEENLISVDLIERLNKPIKKITTDELKPYIKKYEDEFNVELSEKQKLAVFTVMNENVCIITGSAGTGKTTVLKFCIEIYKELFDTDDITLLAPTGRAARRMTEATKHSAATIHSRLCITEGEEAFEDLDTSIAFVDEMSMCGNKLIYSMLAMAAPHTKFVFLGDPQQLPSVDAGNVLADLIASGVIPTVKLDVIYRQCKESLIISNANKITRGISDFQTGDDFVFVNKTGSQEIQKEVLRLFNEEFFDRVKNLYEVQIITPMRERGYLSAKSLNLLVQDSINPSDGTRHTISVNGYEFRVKDKVMCCKNTDTIKNGEIGFIKDIYVNPNPDSNGLVAKIDFYGEEEEFNKDDMKELGFVLAYACTVHKSQGSEFKTVILPINNENKIMLKRNLMYTAVTRASEKMIIVGSKIHYWDAVKNNIIEKRNTLLASRLKKEYLKGEK